jgi:hydrogenase expression/formation protein HypC
MCLGEIGRVRQLTEGRAEVLYRSGSHTVSTMLLEEDPVVGDWLLVHAGFALARLDAAEARAALVLRATTQPVTR